LKLNHSYFWMLCLLLTFFWRYFLETPRFCLRVNTS